MCLYFCIWSDLCFSQSLFSFLVEIYFTNQLQSFLFLSNVMRKKKTLLGVSVCACMFVKVHGTDWGLNNECGCSHRERECCYLICEQAISMSTGCVRSLSETAEHRLTSQERPCKYQCVHIYLNVNMSFCSSALLDTILD